MGALHEGHLSLLRRSIDENDITICSIFVNPIQFNNAEDLEKYPRTLEQDLVKLKKEGCDIVFAPVAEEFYADKPRVSFNFGELETEMEGAFRPGHFNGVAIVVCRLIHLVHADKAYFGLKDLQQYYIVRQMCMDLAIPVEIVANDIVREADGLAMSSRNQRLTPEDRKTAPVIFELLQEVRRELISGQQMPLATNKAVQKIEMAEKIEIEYLKLVALPAFKITGRLDTSGNYAICIAAHLGGVRLIDNLIFDF